MLLLDHESIFAAVDEQQAPSTTIGEWFYVCLSEMLPHENVKIKGLD